MKNIYFYPPNTEGFWAHYSFIKDPYFLKSIWQENCNLVAFSEKVKLSQEDVLLVFEAKNLLPNFRVYLHLPFIIKLHIVYKYLFKKNKYLRLNKQRPKLILIIFESKLHAPENHFKELGNLCHKVLSWNDDLILNTNFEKYLLPIPFEWPQVDALSFSKRKMLVNISANKYFLSFNEFYSKRRKVIKCAEDFFDTQFELYGFDWNKPVTMFQKLFPFLTPNYKSYKGIVQDKSTIFSKFRFALIYENSSVNGYISEKIFDCLRSRCVPVYLGAQNVYDYIPSTVFIDRNKFNSNLELFSFLESVDEKRYNKYLEDIEDFISSAKFQENLSTSFARKIISVVKGV